MSTASPGRRALRAVQDLGWADRVEVARILVVAGVVEVGLRLFTLPQVARTLRVQVDFDPKDRGIPMTDPLPGWARRRLELARGVLRQAPSGPTCLRMSLVSATRLRSLSPKVRIGVARGEGGIKAHAWLEIDGTYFDVSAADFAPIHSLGT